MISPVLREELISLLERVSRFMKLRDRGELPDAEIAERASVTVRRPMQ